MGKGLEALERLRHTPMSYYESKEPHSYKEDIVIIEKELKALEIIRKHCCVIQKGILPKEKQDLLSEVLVCH